eukprot:TRINITY_DN13_c0_g1_i2.p1 TRINITY_DN13_c0_g1~~TRINITY_DN13_c0_g1_i2.p1  ORF type:complete len:237 (-),score=15.49 TRINITY_DN13_c0_g1_i2:79-789(-)
MATSSSNSFGPGDLAARLWVGGLPHGITEDEVEDKMSRFGPIKWVRLRTSARDTFCFLQFDQVSDAQAAIRAMDQKNAFGVKGVIKVSMARPSFDGLGKGVGKIRTRSQSRSRSPRSRSRSRSRRRRSRSRSRKSHHSRSRSAAARQGRDSLSYKLVPICRLEDLPDDLEEAELIHVGAEFGKVVRSKVWSYRGSRQGRLEYATLEEAARAWDALDERRVVGCQRRLRAYIPLHVR